MGNARLICVWIMQIDLTQKKSLRAPRRSNLPRSHVEIKRSDGTTCRSLLRDLPTCRTASGRGRIRLRDIRRRPLLPSRMHTPEFEQPPRPADRTAADRRKRALESTAAETMTRPLFVAAVRQHVGKTTVSLALMNGLRKRFGKVGRPHVAHAHLHCTFIATTPTQLHADLARLVSSSRSANSMSTWSTTARWCVSTRTCSS